MTEHAARSLPGWLPPGLVSPRALALGGGVVLSLSYLSVLYHVVDVAGGVASTGLFLVVVLASLALAAVWTRAFGVGWAVFLGALLLGAGLAVYLLAVPRALIGLDRQLTDSMVLLSGMSVLRVTEAGVWALGLTPAPVFLSWYFFGRRAYGAGALVGAAALSTFVLTGDVETVSALVGVLGGVAAVGFGRFDREGPEPALRNTLVVVLVAMIVVTTSVSLVPGGEARPLLPDGESTTVETSLTGSDARVEVLGSISLSPQVRYSVTASRPRYWRVDAYDRYTGDGWVRTGDTGPYDGRLDAPPAENLEPVQQTFVVESSTSAMPAAWKPIRFSSTEEEAQVTEVASLQPAGSLQPGDRYSVTSLAPATPPGALLDAGTDYPAAVEERYLDLPESTPARLGQFTANLTAEADSPYRKATLIQTWLLTNKRYSLDVERPDGDVASAFVFEMDSGYCTYYATAMVAMLRSQGVPARFVVGYLPGDQVGDDTRLVRGFDSHAWVEVYFPGTGWVQFDPTPAGPRQSAERDRLQQARANGEANVDTNESRAASSGIGPTTPAFGAFAEETGPNASAFDSATGPGAGQSEDYQLWGMSAIAPGEEGSSGPSPTTLLYGLVILLASVTAVHRLGVFARLYRAVWLRRLPAGPPAERIEAAVERGEYLVGQRYRPRRDGETRRAYLRAVGERSPLSRDVDERVETLFRLGERARYAGRATEGDARVAARLLGELRGEFGRLG